MPADVLRLKSIHIMTIIHDAQEVYFSVNAKKNTVLAFYLKIAQKR